jgi:predicted SAM-dependent methyltransferase
MDATSVQFGCGGNILPGFENHDADLPIDRHPLPFESNSVDFIFAEHVFEHVPPAAGLGFLDECFRILKSGGRIRLCVPILESLSHEHARDLIVNHGHAAAYHNFAALKRFLKIAGFCEVQTTSRKEIDGHWKVIGRELDDRETCRIEAVKP